MYESGDEKMIKKDFNVWKMFTLVGLIFLSIGMASATHETSFDFLVQALNVSGDGSYENMPIDLKILSTANCSETPLFNDSCTTNANGVCIINVTMNMDYNEIYYACVYANSTEVTNSPFPFRAGQGQIDENDVDFGTLTADYFIGDGSGLTNVFVNGTSINITADTFLFFDNPNDTAGIMWNSTMQRFYMNDGLTLNDSLLISTNIDEPEDTLDVDGHIILTDGDRYIYSYTSGSYGYNLTVTGGWGGCFTGETLIKTPAGFTAIEDLEINDTLISYNVNTSTQTTANVLGISPRIAPSHYVINNQISVTGEHPLWTKNGWTTVKELDIGDFLFDGSSWVEITRIYRNSTPTIVYNIATEYPRTYFADGILARNKDTSARPGGDLFLIGGPGSYGGTDGDVHIGYDGFTADGYVIISNAYALPDYDGNEGDVLYTDGGGVAYWDTVPTGYWNVTNGAIIPANQSKILAINSSANSYISLDYPTNNVSMGYSHGANVLWLESLNPSDELQLAGYAGISLYGITQPVTIEGTAFDLNSYALYGMGSPSQRIVYNSTTARWEITPNLSVIGNVSANYFVGDGSRLYNVNATGGSSNHSLLTNLNWSIAGHIMEANFLPYVDASYDLGNATFRWRNANLSGNLTSPNINAFATSTNNIGTFGQSILRARNLTIGNSTGNITIGTGGRVTLEGTARVIKEIQKDAYDFYAYAGTRNGITCTASSLSGLQAQWLLQAFADGTGANVCDSAVFNIRLPNDYINGTNFTLDMVWFASATTGNVSYGVGIWRIDENQSFNSPNYTWYTGYASPSGTSYNKVVQTININGTAFKSGDTLGFALYRHGDDAGDTMIGNAYVSSTMLRYLSDRVGVQT